MAHAVPECCVVRIKLPPPRSSGHGPTLFDRLVSKAENPLGGLVLAIVFALPFIAVTALFGLYLLSR
jgi:hypothetical protein